MTQIYWTVDVKTNDCVIVSHGGFCGQHSPLNDQKYPTRMMADRIAWETVREFPYMQLVVTRHDDNS